MDSHPGVCCYCEPAFSWVMSLDRNVTSTEIITVTRSLHVVKTES